MSDDNEGCAAVGGLLIIAGIIVIVMYILMGFLFIIGIGGMVGLPVGIFYGIKNYILSILENIRNKAFKITMIVITSVIIITVLLCIIRLFIS